MLIKNTILIASIAKKKKKSFHLYIKINEIKIGFYSPNVSGVGVFKMKYQVI